jgi:hypothetical protein
MADFFKYRPIKPDFFKCRPMKPTMDATMSDFFKYRPIKPTMDATMADFFKCFPIKPTMDATMADFFKYCPIIIQVMNHDSQSKSMSSFAVFCKRFLLNRKLNKIASFGSIFLRLWTTLWHNLSHIVLKLRRVLILDARIYLRLLSFSFDCNFF